MNTPINAEFLKITVMQYILLSSYVIYKQSVVLRVVRVYC